MDAREGLPENRSPEQYVTAASPACIMTRRAVALVAYPKVSDVGKTSVVLVVPNLRSPRAHGFVVQDPGLEDRGWEAIRLVRGFEGVGGED